MTISYRRAAIFLAATIAVVAALSTAIQLPPPACALERNRTSAAPRTVRVAAIQCPSQMGKITANRQRLTRLIIEAARNGAKIIVLPECSVSGYFDPLEDRKWSRKAEGSENELPIDAIAEHIPGSSTRYFSGLAKELSVYLTVPLAEVDRGKYYNSVALIDPHGSLIARHRKRNLWTPGDSTWVTSGNGEPQVVVTPYGRLGLMICYDVHVMAERLKDKADIVLYSVGWLGPNTEGWYKDIFPTKYVKPNGFAVIASNWSAESSDDLWQGAGYSSIFDRNGTVLAISNKTSGEDIIYADLPYVGGQSAVEAPPLNMTREPDDE